MADQLQNQLSDFNAARTDLNTRLEEQQKYVQQVKDKLNKIDDITGSDEELVERLQTAKVRLDDSGD